MTPSGKSSADDRFAQIAVIAELCGERVKSTLSRPFEIGPMNEREAPENDLRAQAQAAPIAGLPKRPRRKPSEEAIVISRVRSTSPEVARPSPLWH